MHGVLKVRTSEEEKLKKEKERQAKLKVYRHAMQKIQHKRAQGELDKELLEVTGNVLSRNPDINTLWNIRREVLQIFQKCEEGKHDMSHIYDAELDLTEYCLKNNPKSYSAWYQREWVLMNRNDPDWNKELRLCSIYLELDPRNFHTWDYRRFVVSQCKSSLEDEFKYTTEKLHNNFSNYSAWHYRSKMLVALYPDLDGGRPIEDSHHKHELKMIQSAAFTDPDDTSAWFYQRWLLGAVKTIINLVVYTVTPNKTTVAFSNYVNQEFVSSKVHLYVNDYLVNGAWVSCTGNQYDVLWILKHDVAIRDGLDVKIEYHNDNTGKNMIPSVKHKESTYVGKAEISFQRKYSEPVVEELNKQLESCRLLLQLEPDSKWTLLTTTIFLNCIDAHTHYKEIIDNLQTLKTIDKLRAGYYDDLICKWSIEERLMQDFPRNEDLDLTIGFKEKISSLPHIQYYSYCENVDLSNQNITSKVLPSLIVLQNCKKLSLENNQLTTLKNFPKLDLEELNILGNVELDAKEVEQFKEKCNFIVIY